MACSFLLQFHIPFLFSTIQRASRASFAEGVAGWLYTRLGVTARRSLRSAGFDALGMKDFVLRARVELTDECTLMFGCYHEIRRAGSGILQKE